MGRSDLNQRGPILAAIIAAVCAVASAPLYSATPSVLAGGAPYGGTYGSTTEESPTTPLLATYSDAVGLNTVFGEAAPGRLKASSVIVDGALEYNQSLGKAEFIDHFHLTNLGLADNSTGTFIYTFFLSGILKIKADLAAVAAVSVNATTSTESLVGYLEISQGGSTASLYGIGGEVALGYPLNNLFAEADGSMKVYQTATVAGGHFTFNLNFRVAFTFINFPFNQVPSADALSNQVIFSLSAISMKDAESDFSATFEFAEQNPIVPHPFDPSLPSAGWDFSSSSGEISLPAPLSVLTATGTGYAAFGAEFGLVENLVALDETSFPALGLIDGDFPHGFFSFDITGLTTDEVIGVGISLPAVAASDTRWWFYVPGSGWDDLPTGVPPGTSFLSVTAGDGLAGDFDPTAGAITLVGGPGVVINLPIFADGFETGDLIAWE